MLEIPVSKGLIATVDDEDAMLVDWVWFASSNGTRAASWLPQNQAGKRQLILMHRIVYERTAGRALLSSEFVDHKDGNPLNNTRANLRLATHQQNMWNSKIQVSNSCGFKGVYLDKRTGKYWRAEIQIGGKRKYLGRYETPEEAHAAYCKAAVEHHGEFANFG